MTAKINVTYNQKKNHIGLLTTQSENSDSVDFLFKEGYFGLMKTQAQYNS